MIPGKKIPKVQVGELYRIQKFTQNLIVRILHEGDDDNFPESIVVLATKSISIDPLEYASNYRPGSQCTLSEFCDKIEKL